MLFHHERSCRLLPLLAAVWLASTALLCSTAVGQSTLEDGFRQPPATTQPWCYWYWISDNISKDGLTRDLEAMARVGIGEAFIGNVYFDDTPAGDAKVLSEAWWELVEHVIREGDRVGVNIGLFNSPGWSQSGGPWVKPDQAMRFVVSSETRVSGPCRFEQQLPAPRQPFQDVAVLAFPAPQGDAVTLADRAPQVTCTPSADNPRQAVDGRLDTACTFPAGAGVGDQAFTIELSLTEPLTARHVSLYPGDGAWSGRCELQAADDTGEFRQVRSFSFDRSNMELHVGPLPRGPVTVSFTPVTARQFRLVWTQVSGGAALAEIELSPAARVEAFIEKQLGKMHPTPLPQWDTYMWPAQVEPEESALSITPDSIQDLTARMTSDGTLAWDVPEGEWIILRTGMSTTGTKNSPASPEGTGLEIDKMNRAAAAAHFDAFVGEILRRMPASERRALKHIVADSYEMGSQNWTDAWAPVFRERFGYDPRLWLPTLTGRIVGSADQSNRFLWDLRRLVADRIATEYVGGLRDLCRPHGLQLWLENYGHWGFPAEFLQYGGQSDNLGGEFWVTGSLGSIECRAASSAASVYGLPRVSAEAFTGGPPFRNMPSDLKARGDWCFCEGINHFVLHVNIHQPWDDRRPGMNAWFGTEFNRHNTWFDASDDWIMYVRRCCHLLQQGSRVSDVAYFIGEDAPKMTGIREPKLPAGRDFDYVNAEVIENRLDVSDGLLTLPEGTTYRVLVLPQQETMRPDLLRAIAELVRKGATILGPAPSRSPSLQNYPQCDDEVRTLAAELWGPQKDQVSGMNRCGAGRVMWGKSLEDVFEQDAVPPDFTSTSPLLTTHRRTDDADIYFVSNQSPQQVLTTATFRVSRRVPELWCPVTGRIQRAAVYDVIDDTIRMPLYFRPHGSMFVVFRDTQPEADRIVSVEWDGVSILTTEDNQAGDELLKESGGSATAVQNDFTMAVWVKPTADTTLPVESNSGAIDQSQPRNEVLFPPHGNTFGDATHAGNGLAVGRNGVCVLEHGASYLAPVLVHAAPLNDWTHVAIVYRGGRPSLYLNGSLVHTGKQSTHTVHPGTAAGGGDGTFVGSSGSLETLPRVLDGEQVAALMRSMPRPDLPLPAAAINLSRGDNGRVTFTAWKTGSYSLREADGTQHTVQVRAVPRPIVVEGPWEVSFDPKWGGPEQVTFAELVDWTAREEEGIRHYSGRATYRQSFTVPEGWIGSVVRLDLGNVRGLAEVRINGQSVGTIWTAPWSIDVTSFVKSGANTLEVDVVNAWNNRLVGDAALPAEQRYTFLALDTVGKNSRLLPAGLLGPVRLVTAQESELLESPADEAK